MKPRPHNSGANGCRNPRYRVDMVKSTQFDSHGYQGTVGGKSLISYLRLLVDFRPN